jgi:penicillin G amidase
MKKLLKISAIVLAFALLLALAVGTWYVRTKLPVRQGSMALTGLQGTVSVQYDERGVPHIRATSQLDAYRALGYVHAQDRLFQMEMVRRLAKGELAAVLGPKLLESDKLFRALRIREKAQADAAALDPAAPATAALLAYLDGINQYQANRPYGVVRHALHSK